MKPNSSLAKVQTFIHIQNLPNKKLVRQVRFFVADKVPPSPTLRAHCLLLGNLYYFCTKTQNRIPMLGHILGILFTIGLIALTYNFLFKDIVNIFRRKH